MLSIVVNFFNNRREARHSLYSMTRQYQRAAQHVPYEVIVLDHGSTEALTQGEVESFGMEFKYRYVATAATSPANAINDACRSAAGDAVMVIIDGAHILTPGMVSAYWSAMQLFSSPFVVVPAMHLGPKRQNQSILEGYSRAVEDELLNGSAWRENGYRLYSISGEFADASRGWFGALYESNCFGMRKGAFLALGGYDEQFRLPGGGLVNLDFFNRAISTPHLQYVVVLGECTFHQFHGGVSTNATPGDHPWRRFAEDYRQIRGQPYRQLMRRPCYIGSVTPEALPISQRSMEFGPPLWATVP